MKKTAKQERTDSGFKPLAAIPHVCSTCRHIRIYVQGFPFCQRSVNFFSVRHPEKSVCDHWKA